MTTLENSYTVPMTLEEWVQCVPWLKDDPMAEDIAKCAFVPYGDGTIAKEPSEGMVRLSVPRFLDLMHDIITPWRLEEVGAIRDEDVETVWVVESGQRVCIGFYSDGGISVSIHYEYASIPLNITTFTDLLTLIRFLTPNTNKP